MTSKVTIIQDVLTKIKDIYLKDYLKSQIEGFMILKKNIEDKKIECDFKRNDSYLYTTKKSNIKKLKKIEKVLEELRIEYTNESIPIEELKSLYSLKTFSYEINPIKYLNGIIKYLDNILIYEDTSIIEVKKESRFISKTLKGNTISSKKVIFATNYPYFLKPLFFPLKVKLEKSYIEYGTSKYNGNYNLINIDKDIHSIRFYKDKMIYLTGSKYLSHMNNLRNVKSILKKSLISDPFYIWSNQDLITNDYLPIIGNIFKDMYIITGFNTWGILSSHVGSNLISSLILKRKRYLNYKEMFFPRRKITFQKIINGASNIYENINGYFKGMITKKYFIFYSKDEAMYIDKNGICYTVKRKCPHLKCNLIFNEVESTWDCPCHGSRFDLEGNVITGPSKYNIK